MTKIILTQELLKEYLKYNPDNGLFTWIKDYGKNIKSGIDAGCENSIGYIQIGIFGKKYLAHRLAWFYMNGTWPTECLDHIDRNRKNNTYSNLRLASYTNNAQNKKIQNNNTSGFKGIIKCNDGATFRSRIKVDGSVIHIGCFPTQEEAHIAYCFAALEYHKDFAS